MKRRNLLTAVAAGSIGALVVMSEARAATVVEDPGFGAGAGTASLAATTADTTVEPQGGAGLFDVDPDQGNISQSPTVVVTGNVTVLPEDWEL